MALDLTGLQQYVQDPQRLIGVLLNRETVLRYFDAHEGFFPGQAVLRFYTGGGDLGACCTVPTGTGAFSEKLFNIVCIESGNDFCLEDLARYIRDAGMRFTAGLESAGSVEEIIMNQELAKIAKNIDILVFQGDTDETNTNLNRIDGLIKQANEATDSVKLNITSGSVYSTIAQIIAAIPYDAYDLGEVDIFVGREVAARLQSALIALNLYNFTVGQRNPYDVIEFPGFSNVRIIPTRGLDGTNTIIATPSRNIHWLTNLEDDYMRMSWNYTEYHQLYYWRVKFLLGVGFGLTEYVVIATITADVLNAPVGIPVDVVAPRNAAGTAINTAVEA